MPELERSIEFLIYFWTFLPFSELNWYKCLDSLLHKLEASRDGGKNLILGWGGWPLLSIH